MHQLRRHRRSGDLKNAGVLHLPTSKPSVPQSSQSVSKSEDRLGRADLTWTWNRLELKIKSRPALFVKSTHWSDYPGTYFALRKMLPGRVWQPHVGQPAGRISKQPLLRKAWCIMWLVGHPLNPKKQIRLGILQQVYFARREVLPGRVWQPLVGQPARQIGK